MKLKHKLLPILSICGLITAPLTITTSCSCVFELNLTEHEQYVYDRTFSLMGKGGGYCIFGTGWIISDATKNNLTDYKYWLATNWHVTKSMQDKGAFNEVYYGDNSLTFNSQYIEHTNYIKFNDGCYQIEPVKNFVYPDASIGGHIDAIDLSVVKVDFGSPTGAIKTKLDKLNESQKKNGYINKFVKDSPETRAKNKIIGGYPKMPRDDDKATSFGGQWESHSFASSNLRFYNKYTKFDGTNMGHNIGDDFWDVSPQYVFTTPMSKDFMSGGASGSMMITEDYEVCGIYWGGWESGSKYYPAFSLFNTDEINFLEQYINN